MSRLKHGLVIVGIAASLTLHSCSLMSSPADDTRKNIALERWNRCLQRFESNPAHYCDGHRRDVLATYPAHLEDQMNTLLRRQTQSRRTSTLLEKSLGYTQNASHPVIQGVRLELQSRAE